MNYQEEFFNLRKQLRENFQPRTEALVARARRRLQRIRQSLITVNEAGQELGKITGRHAKQFARQNAPLFAAAGKDLSVLARSTLITLQQGPSPRRARKTSASRRARKAA